MNSYSTYPNSPFNSTNINNEKKGKWIPSGITELFSLNSNNSETLPFSYSDASHTKTLNSTQVTSNVKAWLPSFLTSTNSETTTTPSLATSTPLTATQEWIENMGMSRTQRYTAFAICIAAAVFLFFLAMFHLPFVVIRPAKFVVPYCMGSMFILVSFGFLHGFVSYSKHLFSPKKAIYSAWFFSATIGTLYAALSLKSYILTMVMALIQMAGMLTFMASYVPGGSSGISFMSTMITSSIKSRFAPNSF